MRKSMKALAWLLAVLMTISVIPAFTASANAPEYKYLLVNNAEDANNWTQHVSGWTKSVDTTTYTEGTGSMKFVNTDPSGNIGGVFRFMTVFELQDEVSINDYPYFEIFFKGSSERSGQIQVNYALANQDGRNHAPGFTIGTDWSRYNFAIANKSIDVANPNSENNTLIDTFRVSVLGGALDQDYVLNVDGALLYDQAFADARDAAAKDLQKVIDAATTTKKIVAAYNELKTAEASFPNIRFFLTGVEELEEAYATVAEVLNTSPYAEVAHWGIPNLTKLSLSGGAVYGVDGGRASWGSSGMGLVEATGSGNVTTRNVDAQYNVVAYSKVNLINCSALWFPFNPVSNGITAGDNYTIVAKVAVSDLSTGRNTSSIGGLSQQKDGKIIGVSAGTNYSTKLTMAEYDGAPSKIDPEYGYEYKEVTCTAVASDENVNISGDAPAHASGVDFDAFDFFYGFEIYDKDGVKVAEKTTADLYADPNSTFYGSDWGAQWVVDSGYEWNKAAGSGYGVYVDNNTMTTYGAGCYAMEYTFKISDITDVNAAIATLGVNCPDSDGIIASRTLTADDVTEDMFVTYPVYFTIDPVENTSRIEPSFSITDNANVKLTNIKLSKLTVEQSAVAEVIADIDAIDAVITKASIDGVTAARKAYDALLDADKLKVYNYAKLVDAEKAVATLADVIVVSACDDISKWDVAAKETHSVSVKEVENAYGEKVNAIVTEEEGAPITAGVFNAFTYVTFDTAIDLTKTPLFEFVYTTNPNDIGNQAALLQLNFNTSATNKEDGRNFNNLGMDTSAGWHRYQYDATSTGRANDTATETNIDCMRIGQMNYSGTAFDMSVAYTSLVFYNQNYKDKRTKAEKEVEDLISALGEITLSNYEAKAEEIKAIETKITGYRSDFVNYMLANYADLQAAKKAVEEKAELASKVNLVCEDTVIATWGTPQIGRFTFEGGSWNSFKCVSSVAAQGPGYGLVYDETANPNTVENYLNIIGVARSNLIANTNVITTLNFASVGIAQGDEFTVVAKMNAVDGTGNGPINATHNNSFKNSGLAFNSGTPEPGGLVGGIGVGEEKNLYSCADFEALTTYTDSTYGYEYKKATIKAIANGANVDLKAWNSTTAYTDYGELTEFYGFEVYDKDGKLVYEKSVNDLAYNGGANFSGGAWGYYWIVESNYEWDEEEGKMYGDYIDYDNYFADYGEGYYKAEFTMNISNIKDDKLVARVGINYPDSTGGPLTDIDVTNAVQGTYTNYVATFKYEQAKGRVEPIVDVFGNADVKITNVRVAKLTGASLVEALINEIGEVTVDSKDAINTAKDAYAALTKEDQAKVSNYKTLQNAWQTYVDLTCKEFNEQFGAMDDPNLLTPGSPEQADTDNNLEGYASTMISNENKNNFVRYAIRSGAKAFDITDAVNADGKFYLTFDFWVEDPAQFTSWNRAFATIGTASGVNGWKDNSGKTVDFKAAAKDIKAGWNHIALLVDTKLFTTNGTIEWDPADFGFIRFWGDGASHKYNYRLDDVRIMSTKSFAEDYADMCAYKDVTAQIIDLPEAKDVTITDKAAIKAARAAYNALTKDQQENVIHLDKLEAAEQAVAQFKDYVVAVNCEDAETWVQHIAGWEKEVDTEDYTEGEGSMKLIHADQGTPIANAFYVMNVVEFDDIDLAKYPYAEIAVKGSADYTGYGQINFCYDDQDGRNHFFDLKLQAGKWTVLTENIANIGIAKGDSTGNSTFNTIRFSIMNVDMPLDYEFNIDGIIFYNEDFKQERGLAITNAETVISELTNDSTTDDIKAAIKVVEDGKAEYPNFIVSNMAKLDRLSAYLDVIDLIDAIGDVTAESGDAIEAARAAYDALDSAQQAKVTNYETLTTAETAYAKIVDDAAAAKQVDDLIEALPAAENIKESDEEAITASRTAYTDLTEDQKALVKNLTTLEAAEAALEEAKSGVIGDLDGQEGVTASDALLALQGAVGKVQLTEKQAKLADVDGNKTVDASDALLILQKAVGKIQYFPIEN